MESARLCLLLLLIAVPLHGQAASAELEDEEPANCTGDCCYELFTEPNGYGNSLHLRYAGEHRLTLEDVASVFKVFRSARTSYSTFDARPPARPSRPARKIQITSTAL